MSKKSKAPQPTCDHLFPRISTSLDCSAGSYCCNGDPDFDGHYCSREHTFQVTIYCPDCNKQLSTVEYDDIDSFVERVRKELP